MTDHKQQLRFKTTQLSNNESAKLDQNIEKKEAQLDIVENTPE
jgi:sigma-E factor negative regulatory protein RseA